MQTPSKAYGALGITSLVWGTTWVVSKLGIRDMPALQMAAIRQLLAGLCFVLFFKLVKKEAWPTRAQFLWIGMLAILMFVLANGLSTWSLAFIPTGLAALIGALYPLSVVLIERIFFHSRRITPLTLTGLMLGITGIGVVFYENAFGHPVQPGFYFGVGLAVIAMLSWSLGTIFIARNKANINPYYGVGWQMMFSALILYGWSLAGGQHIPVGEISLHAWLVIGYLVLMGSILSFIAFIYSMKRLPAAVASLYAYINPLVAMLMASFLLREPLTIYIAWGAVITLLGVFLVNFSMKKQELPAAEPEQ